MAENEQNRPDSYYVSQQEPEAKSPPALETGVLKWIRENLFNSSMNTVLTILGALLIYYTVSSITNWVVRDANWLSVSINIRNYMLGSYEREYEWRVSLTLFISVFAIGTALSVWIRQAARTMLISMLVILFGVLVLPRLITASMDLPVWYAGAGNVEVVAGTTTEVALNQVAFIGQEGDDVVISMASDDVASEEALANANGYVDRLANTLRNLAANRLDDLATLENFQGLIAEQDGLAVDDIPVLTVAQYEEYTGEIEAIERSEPIRDLYNINQIPVLVEILEVTEVIDADTEEVTVTMEVIASAILAGADDSLEVTLPADSWYILHKELVVDGASETEGLALLEVQGIYPSAKRVSTQAVVFTRRPDGFALEDRTEPEIDGETLPFIDIIRNQYRGDRSFEHFMRTNVAPFMLKIATFVTTTVVLGIAGFFVTDLIRNMYGAKIAGTFATYALLSIPFILWMLVNGMFLYTVFMWMLFVSMCLFSYLIYKFIQRDGYSPVFALAGVVLYVVFAAILLRTGPDIGEAYLLSIGDFNLLQLPQGFDFKHLLSLLPLVIDDGAVPRFLVWLGIIIIPFSIYSGKNAHIPGDEVEFNLPLLAGMAGIFFLGVVGATELAFELPAYTLNMFDMNLIELHGLSGPVTLDTEWTLQPSDPRGWGGLLLTMVLTIYGIIIAFPIGVGLALGRRSDLPLIKWLCTLYIELVRGSPFITVLFFMQLFIPLINPNFSEIPGGYRAIAATIAFSAAYLAENVRGGLQSLPPGQEEAAQALGLNPWQSITLITMPQALRAVIPALVGMFIGLFKDTSLVTIVGLIDLVGIVNTVTVQAEFIGTRLEGLLFISVLYFVVSYGMSYISRLLEASGSGSTRRM